MSETTDTTMQSTGYLMGLDLGQAADYTAIAVVERMRVGEPPKLVPAVRYNGDGSWTYSAGGAVVGGGGMRYPTAMMDPAVRGLFPQRGPTPPPQQMVPGPDTRAVEYHLRHLERPALGTKYPTIVARVKTLLATPPLTLHTPLVIDRTGVGRPVTDLFEGQGVHPYAITITGGDEVSTDGPYHTKVPKRELVSTLVAVFQTGRLKIAAGLAEGPVLVNELTNFKVKVNLATGNDSYEAYRESVHDDLVLAVAMAVWHGEHTRERPYEAIGGGVRPVTTIRQ